MRLQDKSAVITGAASGIGRAIALKFVHEGAAVIAADLDGKAAMSLADEIEADGGSAIGIGADITKRAEIDAMVAAVIERFGYIDVLVNNAGGEESTMAVDDVDEAAWDRIVGVNLKASFLCAKAVISTMKAQKRGAIVNVSSQGGRAYSQFGNAPYAAAKAGLLGLTRQLAWELGPCGIRVNAVAPGFVRSNPTTERHKHVLSGESLPEHEVVNPGDHVDGFIFLTGRNLTEGHFITGI